MAKHGFKKFSDAKTEAAAQDHLWRASQLLAEAMSHVASVAFSTSLNIPQIHRDAANKIYDEIKLAERTYHNYLVGQPLDRPAGGQQ
jgi:hypothetical protein